MLQNIANCLTIYNYGVIKHHNRYWAHELQDSKAICQTILEDVKSHALHTAPVSVMCSWIIANSWSFLIKITSTHNVSFSRSIALMTYLKRLYNRVNAELYTHTSKSGILTVIPMHSDNNCRITTPPTTAELVAIFVVTINGSLVLAINSRRFRGSRGIVRGVEWKGMEAAETIITTVAIINYICIGIVLVKSCEGNNL